MIRPEIALGNSFKSSFRLLPVYCDCPNLHTDMQLLYHLVQISLNPPQAPCMYLSKSLQKSQCIVFKKNPLEIVSFSSFWMTQSCLLTKLQWHCGIGFYFTFQEQQISHLSLPTWRLVLRETHTGNGVDSALWEVVILKRRWSGQKDTKQPRGAHPAL